MTTSETLKTSEGLKRIGYYKSMNLTWPEITRKVNEEFHTEVTIPTVRKIYQTYVVKRKEIIEGDVQLKSELKQTVIDWKDQLKRANEIVWETINSLRAKKKTQELLRAIDRLHNQLYLQNKILNEMNKHVSLTQFNTVEITQVLTKNLHELEKQGFIKILDLPEHWKGGKDEIKVRTDEEGGWK